MTNRLWATAIERASVLTAPFALDELSDADLVRRFLLAREEPAFAAIVRRHGPLVWGVCRNLVPTEADAEDAFQATFLALVKSAVRIQRPNALGAWLHRVAGRVCRHSLRAISRRRKHEQSAAIVEAACPIDAATWDRWHAAIHEEIDRLPDTLRVPFVLCVLQGLRQPEAARRLGWKLGTVSGRVCKAKQALAEAVTRRGLTGAAVLAGVFAGAAPLSAALVARGKAVITPGPGPGNGISPTVHELACGAMGGLMSKTKLLAAAFVVGTLAIGVGTSVLSKADAQGFDPRGPGPGGPPPGMGPGSDDTAGQQQGEPGGGPAGPGPRGGRGASSSGMSGGSAARAPRIEYQFLARPKGADAFKKLLTTQGSSGWEYVGVVPGDDELIFKRLQQQGGGFGGFGGMGGMGAGGMSMPGMGGFGGGIMPGGGGLGGMSPFGGGGLGVPAKGPTGGGALPGPGGPKGGPGGLGSGIVPKSGETGAPGGGAIVPQFPKGATTITIRVGETIRHKMTSQQQIDRVFNHDLKVADAGPDPTDSKRVLIKGLAPGGARLELTDANGAKEEYMVRVR